MKSTDVLPKEPPVTYPDAKPMTIAERIEVISESISLHTVSKKAAKAVLENLVRQACDEARDEGYRQTLTIYKSVDQTALDKAYAKGFADARERSAKISQHHKCNSQCADRGMGQTCGWEVAEDIRALTPGEGTSK